MKWIKEHEYLCKPIHVVNTHIRLYSPSNFQYKQLHYLVSAFIFSTSDLIKETEDGMGFNVCQHLPNLTLTWIDINFTLGQLHKHLNKLLTMWGIFITHQVAHV